MSEKTVHIQTIGEAITTIATSNIDLILWYSFSITIIAIIMVVRILRKESKYRTWKTDKINLFGLYEREWSATEDEVLRQLWDENQRLEGSVAEYKQKYRAARTTNIIIAVILMIYAYIFVTDHKHFGNKLFAWTIRIAIICSVILLVNYTVRVVK
ncbi:hypothetical protein [Fluviicola sp.]|uniref:hypothetical protein n=1 Tax=Fluviicola sp. TaxID=1917219 RepID=UPI0031E2B192